MKNTVLTLLFGCCALTVAAADKLAVAEPVGSSVSPEELKVFWGMLEADAGGGQYELITRSALQSMLTEIGLTNSSGLVNLNSEQKAKISQLKGVKYILASNIGKLGSRYNVTLMVLDASTGAIRSDQRTSVTVGSMDELADQLKVILRDIGIGPAERRFGRSAVLAPVIRASGAPGSLGQDIVVSLENALLDRGIRLQNLKTVTPILTKNGIGSLAEAEPALFTRIGELLRVDDLIQVSVSRFSLRREKRYIEVTRREVVRHLGDMEGSVRIISAQTGEVVGAVPFKQKVNFDQLAAETRDWTAEDYARYLIDQTMPQVCAKVAEKLEKK